MSRFTSKDKQGLALITGVLLAVVAMFVFNARLSSRPKPDARNCVGLVTSKTVLLIDQSDAIPEQTSIEIRNRALKTVSADVKTNELVSVYAISDDARAKLLPVFSACKPQSDGSELTENVKGIKRRFSQQFEKPLEAALAAKPKTSKASPIGEVIIDLSLSENLRAEQSRLIVFSDMLQNSGSSSLYGCSGAQAAIRDFRQHRAGAKERPEFINTRVELNFIPRQGVGEAVVSCRAGFWAWFFGDNEGENANLSTDFLPG